MSAISLLTPSVLSAVGRVVLAGGAKLASLIANAGYQLPPPVAGDGAADDLETRLMVALICAAHF